MKKLFLTLAALFTISFAGFADTTLAEAYTGLSKLSGMNEQTVNKVMIDNNNSISNVKVATVYANESNVQNYRDNFIYMMENLPMRNMVIGANNMRELASVYSTPAGGGMYNVLIIKGNTLDGNFTVSYGQTNAAGIKAMRNSQVTMDANELVLAPAPQTSPADSFITMGDE
ncbi:MAG: hypothetical protein HDR88_02285 [Bacteroides sp.]|nr:hypothetical protein [Bacteroides sp.]